MTAATVLFLLASLIGHLVKLFLSRESASGTGSLVFSDTMVFDSQTPPQIQAGIPWFGGTVRIGSNCESTWYQDFDGDGFGDPQVTQLACKQPAGFVADNTDCDDANAGSYPGAPELCDGLDNDCDGSTDEDGHTEWYQDQDGDGFGDPLVGQTACSQPTGFIADSTDCDDGDIDSHPGASEVCDGADNDCDGEIDNVRCARFDVNGDGVINGVELAWLGRAFGSCRLDGSSPWWLPIDYNGDDCVDGGNLAILAANWFCYVSICA